MAGGCTDVGTSIDHDRASVNCETALLIEDAQQCVDEDGSNCMDRDDNVYQIARRF